LFIFGMGLSIPEDQQRTCLELSQPFWLQTSLANDYHSWEREYQAACDNGQASVTNAIWVFMNKHSMTCDEAKLACREKARQYAAEYVQVVEAAKAREDLCDNAKFLLEALKFGITGNIVWGLQCPRYHADRTLNARQLEMAKAIGADETIGWEHDRHVGNGITDHPAAETNGAAVNGAVENDTAHAVVEPNGVVANGAVINSALTNGVATTNGAVANDAAANGAVTNGTAEHTGVETNGVVANGAVANGAITNGVSHHDTSVAREVPALGMEVSTRRTPFRRRN
jgi:fusicocca-2,10(14)-diene synthase/ophiobolin F synthase